MKITLNFIIGFMLLHNIVFAIENSKILKQSEFENQAVYINVNSYKILQFTKRIKTIQITNSENITAEIMDNPANPLTTLKVFGKKPANESAIVSFHDDTLITIGFNIVPHLKHIIAVAQNDNPNLDIRQINDTIVLKGSIKGERQKEKVIDLFVKSGVDIEKQLVDLVKVIDPTKMIRVKLYVVEINNDEGLTLKNNWAISRKNYFRATDPDSGLLYNVPVSGNASGEVNSQRNFELEDALDQIMTNSVSLSGGLTGTANYLGKHFNTALTLNYLADQGVANILDETTLITLEKKKADFHAGGVIYIKVQGTTAQGVPFTEVREVDYGLQLDIESKEIQNGEYVELDITTKSTKIDWANQVDGIPSFLEKAINTHVVVKDGATVILGGLINNNNSKDVDKIPLLGDIPILGFLFKSEAFRQGKSELVFFITPEIIDPTNNNQADVLSIDKKRVIEKQEKLQGKERILDILNLNFDSDKEENKLGSIEQNRDKSIKVNQTPSNNETNLFKKTEPKLTDEELHQKRVNQLLGYE